MLLDHFFQVIPHFRSFLFMPLTSDFHAGDKAFFFQFMENKRFEQFESHLFGKATLIQFQLRAHDDNRTTGIINSFSEKVLPEAPLFSPERFAQRFQGSAISSEMHPTPLSVVKKSIHRFL